MRGTLLVVVLVGLVLVVADRGGVVLAERAVADRLAQSGLTSAPSVDIREVPFLTQAGRGRYEEVVVTATDVAAGEVRLARLDATLTGVRLPLGDVIAGSVSSVPVDRLQATVLLGYGELRRRTRATEVTVEPVGDRLRIRGTVEVLGQTLSATADSTVELVGEEIVVTAQSFDVGSGVANRVLTTALRGTFDFRIALEELPYGLVATRLRVTDAGLVLDTAATDVVLTP